MKTIRQAAFTFEELLHKLDISTVWATHQGRKTSDDGWEHDAWKVMLKHGKRRLGVDFRMGTGHNGKPPDTQTVISSVISDVDSVDDLGDFVTFEDWAENMGYETDSRKAHKIYTACKKLLPRVVLFLGDDWAEVVAAAREN